MNIDTSDLEKLADDLEQASKDILEEVKKVTAKGALNVKKDAQRRISGLAHAPAYPRSISYDVRTHGMVVEAEIGPDKNKRQGPLGNILEFGTVNNPPHPHLSPALDAETSTYERYVADAGAQVLK
jgi:HK97 gp10 family phage protein